MPAATKPCPEPALSLTGLQLLETEPHLSQKFCMRLSASLWADLQRVSSAAGVTPSHAARRLLALGTAALLADQEAA